MIFASFGRGRMMLLAAMFWVGPVVTAAQEQATQTATAPAVNGHAAQTEAVPAVHEAAAQTETIPAANESAAPTAADEHAAQHDAVAGEAHAPPNLFSVEPGLMIWTVVTFIFVLIILRLTAWKPIMKGLQDREKSIAGAIAEAAKIKTEAEALFAKYESMLEKSKDEARAILDEARKDGMVLQEELRNRARQEAEEFKARAHREIELQKDAALKEIWQQTATLSTALASRVLGRTLQGSDQERLVKELLEGMQTEMGATGARASAANTARAETAS
ncbi:MAG TPA: F0F1 ATP synthase subunit B [bacterium]|nr:F0F1 ATP synthase subunit B [bacterium]